MDSLNLSKVQLWKNPSVGDFVIYHDIIRDKHTKAKILKIYDGWSADLLFIQTGFTIQKVPFRPEPSHRSWSWI